MAGILWGTATAAVISAWGYLSYIKPVAGAKYYVSQQLAQMQIHRFNKHMIIKACRKDPKLQKLIKQIFEDYEKDIEFDSWCWVKHSTGGKTAWACIPKNKYPGLRKNQRFGGIFPPIASLESTIEDCGITLTESTWLNEWKNAVKGYAAGYFSNLEYYVLQLEALEQDMSTWAMDLKF